MLLDFCNGVYGNWEPLVRLLPSPPLPSPLLPSPSPGDIHGQYYDLLCLFEYSEFPPESIHLFLGDYVDRGKQSLETICLQDQVSFFLLRGNHECASVNRICGFMMSVGRFCSPVLYVCIWLFYSNPVMWIDPTTFDLAGSAVVDGGYEFFAKWQLVTLFSAPNYCGEFDNAGAMMSVDETLMCSFQVRVGVGR